MVQTRIRKKFIAALALALIPLLFAVAVWAAIGSVSNFIGNPTSTTVTLSWVKASGSTNTTVRYSTTTFPATTADGVLVYNGMLNHTTVTGLNAGQTYYFAAWGWNSVDGFSAVSANLVMSTLAVDIASGAQPTAPSQITAPVLDARSKQSVDITGLNLQPISGIIRYFVGDGLGMPLNDAAEWGVAIIIVVAGIWVYSLTHSFFAGFAVVLLLSMAGVRIHLIQEFLIGVEIIIGAGVWAIDKYYQ